MSEQPEQVSSLHRRASQWHEHNGSAADAIRHALAAEDFERAATLIELAQPEIRRNRQGATVTELGGNGRWQVNVVQSVLYLTGIGLSGFSIFKGAKN